MFILLLWKAGKLMSYVCIAAVIALGVSPYAVGLLEIKNHFVGGDELRPWVLSESELSRLQAMRIALDKEKADMELAARMDAIDAQMDRDGAPVFRKGKKNG